MTTADRVFGAVLIVIASVISFCCGAIKREDDDHRRIQATACTEKCVIEFPQPLYRGASYDRGECVCRVKTSR